MRLSVPVFQVLLLPFLSSSIWSQTTDLARGKPVKASSVQTEGNPADYKPEYAVDGKANTRWGSEYKENQWIYVDLGSTYKVTRVVLKWEDANPKDYRLEVSNDALTWDTLITLTGKPIGERTDDVTLPEPKVGRYVRMYGLARNQSKLYLPLIEYNGYSLWNYEVYGSAAAPTAIVRPTRMAAPGIRRATVAYTLSGRRLKAGTPE
jgi:hypothetical protein